jgi:hypothetical protein
VRVKGGFTVGAKAGANSFRFTGRLGKRKLRRGRYRLDATPTAGTKLGKALTAKFRIR